MEYTATHTAMMDVIANLNNRIVPVHLPYEYESFLTSEVINGIIGAMNYNLGYKCFHFYTITPLEYFEGVQMSASITYRPFDIEPEVVANSVQLSPDFEFTLDNTFLYSWYYGATIERRLKDLISLNRSHRYFHSLGFEPYSKKNMDTEAKFSGLFYTKKDYFPSANSSAWAKSNYPINPKIAYVDDSPNDTNLREVFGFPPKEKIKPDGTYNFGTIFATGSPQNLDNVIHSSIRLFKALSHDGLILRPSEGGEVLPYHNKVLYYANPLYGYYDNFYDVKPFWGGGSDSLGHDYITGTAYACGFNVVWFTDTEFWITLKYKLVYQDKRPIEYDPTLCCLAQCFGITN